MRKLLSKAEKKNRALESILEDERKASEILHVRNEGLNAKLKKLREAVETSVSFACVFLCAVLEFGFKVIKAKSSFC